MKIPAMCSACAETKQQRDGKNIRLWNSFKNGFDELKVI